jgi:hypothetical protein
MTFPALSMASSLSPSTSVKIACAGQSGPRRSILEARNWQQFQYDIKMLDLTFYCSLNVL